MEIFTDSCCDLSPDQIKSFNIHVVPLGVFIDGESYLDGVNISAPELFALVKKTGGLPKTSAPAQGIFMDAFSPYDDIIYISISSRLSASYQNGLIAAKALKAKKIQVVDSNNLSTGIGLLVLKAAEMRDEGKTSDEIVSALNSTIDKVNTSFVIDTLDYLHMGGRCTAMELIIGSMLKIRPVIEVKKDGSLGVKEKISGTRKKALDSMLLDFKSKLPGIDLHRVFVTHAYCQKDAEYLKDELLKLAPIEEVCFTTAGATISSHCGPDCIGILFIQK
ncbi:MAG: DegV family protein [Anaerolineaceae bacterium]|nr:DegV family protein [Anaerolineaceae bacterium]